MRVHCALDTRAVPFGTKLVTDFSGLGWTCRIRIKTVAHALVAAFIGSGIHRRLTFLPRKTIKLFVAAVGLAVPRVSVEYSAIPIGTATGKLLAFIGRSPAIHKTVFLRCMRSECQIIIALHALVLPVTKIAVRIVSFSLQRRKCGSLQITVANVSAHIFVACPTAVAVLIDITFCTDLTRKRNIGNRYGPQYKSRNTREYTEEYPFAFPSYVSKQCHCNKY